MAARVPTIPEPSLPLGHRKVIQIDSAGSVPAAKSAIERLIGSLVPNTSSAAVQAAAQSLLNVAMQTTSPRAQDKMIQEMRTVGTIGEWAWHEDRIFVRPTMIVLDDWAGEYLFDMFPLEAMPPDGRAVKISVDLRYAEVPLQEIRAEHAPNRTIERQTKRIEFSLVPYGIALEADLNLIDQNEQGFREDMTEQVAIIQLSFLKTKKLACMLALLEGPFLDRIFLGKMQKALLDVKSTVKSQVRMFGVLNTMDTLGGLLQLKTAVDAFQRDISKQPFARMIFDARVPYAVAYGGQFRNNFINAALVGTAITEATLASPDAPLDRIFPTLSKHNFVRDPKLVAHGVVAAEGRRTPTSKFNVLDARQYGTVSVPPKGRDDFENMITSYIPNMSTGIYQEFTLRDAVKHDEHFNEAGKITEHLPVMVQQIRGVLQSQGIASELPVFDPFVFAVHKQTPLADKYKNPKDSFHVIDFWGDVEPEYLDWDQPTRNGRAWRYFVLNSPACRSTEGKMAAMLCEVFALIERLDNPDMSDERARAFLAAPALQQPDGPDAYTRMFTGHSSVFQLPDLPGIKDGKLTIQVNGHPQVIIADDERGFVLGAPGNGAGIDAPRYPYGFGSVPGLLMLGDKIAKGEMKDWLAENPDLRLLGDFYKFALSLTTLAERCYPDCIFLDGVRYTPHMHKTKDKGLNTVIALLSNTMFAVKYPYFLKHSGAPVTTRAFSLPESKAIAKVLLNEPLALTATGEQLAKLLRSVEGGLMLPSEFRGQMKDLEQLQQWVDVWKAKGLDLKYLKSHALLTLREQGTFEKMVEAEVLPTDKPPEQRLFVLRMLLEALSANFHWTTVDDEWFGTLRKQATQVFTEAKERSQRIGGGGLASATKYANARHTISAQAFLQLQRLTRMARGNVALLAQYGLFLPAHPDNPSRPLQFVDSKKNLQFMDYAQIIATARPGQSPLEATAFAHPSLFVDTSSPSYEPATTDNNNNNDDDDDDDQPSLPLFKLARSTGASKGRAMREWLDIFRGYAGTELMFFHRENLVRRIEHSHQELQDPLERMGAMMVATSRATRQSLEAMLACEQPIPLDTYALMQPAVVFDTSHMLFTQAQVGSLFVRDYLAGLSTGRTNRATVDSTHEVVTANFNFHLVAGVTAMNSVLAIPDVYVAGYVRGGDLKVAGPATERTAYFVNLGGKYTREYVTHVEQGMLSLAGLYHVQQFPVPLDNVAFKREPWPSSVLFSYMHKWAERILGRQKPETIRNLVALHRDKLLTGLMFEGTGRYWNRKTGQFETQQGVGHLDRVPIEQLKDVIAC